MNFIIVGEHRWGTHAEGVVVPAGNVRSKPVSLSWERAAAADSAVVGAAHVAVPGSNPATTSWSASAGHLDRRVPPGSSARRTPLVGHHQRQRQARWAADHGATRQPHVEPVRRDRPRRDPGPGRRRRRRQRGHVDVRALLRSLARGGRLVQRLHDGPDGELHLPTVFWRQLEVIGSTMNDHREFADAPARGQRRGRGRSTRRSASRSSCRARTPRPARASARQDRAHALTGRGAVASSEGVGPLAARGRAQRRADTMPQRPPPGALRGTEPTPEQRRRQAHRSPAIRRAHRPVDHVERAEHEHERSGADEHPSATPGHRPDATRGTGTSPAPLGVTPRVTRIIPGHDRSMQTARPDPQGGHRGEAVPESAPTRNC